MNKARRYDNGKLKWHLVDFKALEPLVRVMMYGAEKYTTREHSGEHNWKNGMDMTTLYNCAMRHLVDLLNGDTIDLESGLPIVGHLMANIMMISHYQQKEEKGQLREFVKELMKSNGCCGNWNEQGECKCHG